METVCNSKYADSGVGEPLHPYKVEDTKGWSKRLADQETAPAAETGEGDLNQSLDELEVVGMTKRTRGINHDPKQWNKNEM